MLSLFQKDKSAKSAGKASPAVTTSSVVATFELAEAQRAKVEVTLPEGSSGLQRLVCQIESVHTRSLCLRASSLKGIKASWIDNVVDVFFGVKDRKTKHTQFFGFATHILDAKVSPAGDVLIDLQIPSELESRQRRKNVRVRPTPRRVPAFSMWDYLDPCWPDSEPLVSILDFAKGLVRFVDISAGGLRVEYDAKKVATLPIDPLPGDRFVVNMALVPMDGADKIQVWLVAKATHVGPDGKGGMIVGLSFIEEGHRDSMTGQLTWQPVRDYTCQDIGAVTYQWSLEAYRKGMTDIP